MSVGSVVPVVDVGAVSKSTVIPPNVLIPYVLPGLKPVNPKTLVTNN